jgi:hypothetical protein
MGATGCQYCWIVVGGCGVIIITEYVVHILILGSVSHLSRRVASLHCQHTASVCCLDERFEGWVRFWGNRFPIINFFEWKDAGLHQQSDGIVDDLCVGEWVLCKDLYLLALFNPVEKGLRCVRWVEWILKMHVVS